MNVVEIASLASVAWPDRCAVASEWTMRRRQAGDAREDSAAGRPAASSAAAARRPNLDSEY